MRRNIALMLFALLVFQTIEVAGIACLVGAGDTRTGLWVMIGVAVVNVPLAWGFGRGLGPCRNWASRASPRGPL